MKEQLGVDLNLTDHGELGLSETVDPLNSLDAVKGILELSESEVSDDDPPETRDQTHDRMADDKVPRGNALLTFSLASRLCLVGTRATPPF